MFKSERNSRACRALADTTTTEIGCSGKMSLCRACLVLLGAQDAAYDLCSEKNLAAKFFGCMATSNNAFWKPPFDQDMSSEFVLHCICECCYQLVQKFHDFQCMCEESLKNFETIMLEVNISKDNDDEEKEGQVNLETKLETDLDVQNEEAIVQVHSESIEEIEEVYIIEDNDTKEVLGHEKITVSGQKVRPRRVGNKLDCRLCGRGFYKMSLYEAHMQKHRGEQPYKCAVDECGKTYARANLLRAHLEEAHGNCVTSYPCLEPNCHKVYTALRSLNYHVRRQHTTADKETEKASSHICEKCGKSYGRRAHLTRHQWVHKSKGECKFACDHCDKRFYTNENLKDHILRNHSRKQPFRCRRCGRIFESRASVSIHMKKKHIHMKKSHSKSIA